MTQEFYSAGTRAVNSRTAKNAAVDGRSAMIEGQRFKERTGSGLPVHCLANAEVAALQNLARHRRSHSADRQCAEVLQALRAVPSGASVRDLQELLCIGHAPRRVADLRADGHTIASEQVVQVDPMGCLRRTCRYVLQLEPRHSEVA